MEVNGKTQISPLAMQGYIFSLNVTYSIDQFPYLQYKS